MKNLLILPLFAVATACPVQALFNPGSIDGQEGWNGGGGPINPGAAQAIVATEGISPSGAFLFSNSGSYNGGFGGWVYSPKLGVTAGQPSSGAAADSMSVEFWFKSVSSVADGTNLELDFATSTGSDRNNFFALTNDTDGDGGFKIRFAGSDLNGFTPQVFLATNIARNTWNKVNLVFKGLNGEANDTLTILLNDNVIAASASTFEGYRNALPDGYQTVDGILMRSGLRASGVDASFNDTTSPQGILIDDLSMRIFDSAAPSLTLGSYSTNFTAAAPVPTFANFIQANFSPAEQADPLISGPNADPDGDSLSNLLEYAFASLPRDTASAKLPQPTLVPISSDRFVGLTYIRVKNAPDLTFTPEFSAVPDAYGFSATPATVVSVTDNANGSETVVIRDTIAVTPSTPRFLRLRVEQN